MTRGGRQAIGLLLASVILGVGTNFLRSAPLSWTEALDADDPPPAAEPGAGLPARDASAAVAGWEEGAFFVDARPRSDFEDRRVPGAFSLPANEFEQSYLDVAMDLPLELPLFVYGAGPDSHLVRRVAAELMNYGHEQVELVVCGLDGLVDAGMAEETGE